jgi:hypothetical protein
LDSPRLAALDWVVSTDELFAAGLSSRQIDERVAAGVLHRQFRGVYAVGRPQLSFEGRCRAAWLACGPDSAVSHISAARDWNVRQSTGAIHISVPRGRRGHPGLIVHRPRSLPLDDIVQRDGFAVTSVARTLLDMAPGCSVDIVGRWMHEAGVQRVLDCREIWAVLQRQQHQQGARIVEAALALEVAPTRSGLEDLLLAVVRSAGLPAPLVNHHLWSGARFEELDVCWPELGVIVEVDGARYHASRWRRRRDAEKDARFRALGWIVWRVPELQITLEPAAVAAELVRLATLGRLNPGNTHVG